jgi:hypothetical protein
LLQVVVVLDLMINQAVAALVVIAHLSVELL